jgi:hypothetical protein
LAVGSKKAEERLRPSSARMTVEAENAEKNEQAN